MSASPADKPAGLSVFFPAYNDSGTIASMVIRAVQAASELTPDFEVIVVNDGSADATPQIADELARTYPQVRVVHHPKNRGYGGALQTGFRSATKELIFYTDGDAQYDPAELAVLWAKMTPDADLVNGYKISRSDPLHRIVIGRALPPHRQPAVRPEGARRRLRFPADAPGDLRADRSREDQRRHLPRDDEEDPGRRLPHRRSAGAPLSPRVRQVAVLQLPAHRQDRRRRAAPVVRAGRSAAQHLRAPASSRSPRSADAHRALASPPRP